MLVSLFGVVRSPRLNFKVAVEDLMEIVKYYRTLKYKYSKLDRNIEEYV